MDDEQKRHIAELEGEARTLRELNGHLMLERDDAIDVAMNTENENDTLRARIAELEARWASVPWEALRNVIILDDWGDEDSFHIARGWFDAHAPKEPQP